MRKLIASDVGGNRLGHSVAVQGTEIISGANTADSSRGAVYTFNQIVGTAGFTQGQKLQASDGAANHQFGYSVAICGDYLVAGSPYVTTNQGSAYVFHKSGGVWTELTKLIRSDGAVNSYFGFSVAISDNYVFVGAYYRSGAATQAGRVYVYDLTTLSGPTDLETQMIDAPDAGVSFYFGSHLSVSGSTLAVCSSGVDSGKGAIYTYNLISGLWTFEQKLYSSDGLAGDCALRRASVCIDGDRLAFGAAEQCNSGFTDAGAVYVFERSGGVWTETQKLLSSTPANDNQWGFRVSLLADRLIVGKLSAPVSGSATVFEYSGGAWTEIQELRQFPPYGRKLSTTYDKFGDAVAQTAALWVIGAPGNYVAGTSNNPGMVFVFLRDSTGSWLQEYMVHASHVTSDFYSWCEHLESSAKYTILGDRWCNAGGYIQIGQATIIDHATFSAQVIPWPHVPTYSGVFFGQSVSVDGDYAAVGAPREAWGATYQPGAAYIYQNIAGVWTQIDRIVRPVPVYNECFGAGVYLKDGFLFIGREQSGFGGQVVQVYRLVAGVWTHVQEIPWPAAAYDFGEESSFCMQGTTLAIGAGNDYSVANEAGAVYMYEYDGSSWVYQQRLTTGVYRGAFSALFGNRGRTIALDQGLLVIGCPRDPARFGGAGTVYVYEQVGGVWTLTATLILNPDARNQFFGSNVAVDGTKRRIFAGACNRVTRNAGEMFYFDEVSPGNWVQNGGLATVQSLHSFEDTEYQFSDAEGNDSFAGSGSLVGDMVVVGSSSLYVNTVKFYWPAQLLTAPYLISGPLTPNNHLTTVPMEWSVGCASPTGDIAELVVGGITAVLNNVVQPGFTGTVVANAFNGHDVSIVADVDYWPWDLSIVWTLTMQNGTLTAVETDTLVKYIPPPVITLQAPRGPGVDTYPTISFTTMDDVNVVLGSIQVDINSVIAVKDGVLQPGWLGPLSAITVNLFNGFDVVIDHGSAFAYGERYLVRVVVEDVHACVARSEWEFIIRDAPDCFNGPLNAFELALLAPYTQASSALRATEQLRQLLLECVIDHIDPTKAIRLITLRAHSMELAPVLQQFVAPPTAKELASKLCYKRTLVRIDATLRRKEKLLTAALEELRVLGLSRQQYRMLATYLKTDQPNDRVPVACMLVCLAKAFELA